jgi:hypothetical protein
LPNASALLTLPIDGNKNAVNNKAKNIALRFIIFTSLKFNYLLFYDGCLHLNSSQKVRRIQI